MLTGPDAMMPATPAGRAMMPHVANAVAGRSIVEAGRGRRLSGQQRGQPGKHSGARRSVTNRPPLSRSSFLPTGG
eukprot:5904807-Prymnesium_polylepis.1